MARASVHASTAAVALLFALGSVACGSSARRHVDAGGDALGADDGDIEDDAPDAPDDADDGGEMDAEAGADDADAASDPDAAEPDAGGGDVSPPVCGSCAAGDWGTPGPIGMIPSLQLPELSGLAASRRHPGALYAHNDSGDYARFFAIDESARFLAQIDLPGATSIDWEDLAVARCPTGWCVFVADIGDNDLDRTECAVYRVPEPETLPTDGSTISASFERLPFVYPDADGRHNAEALLVEPQSQRIFVVTKETGIPSRVYELPAPLTPNVRATLVFVGTLSVPATAGPVTGGAFNACGDRILIRSRTAMFELARAASADIVSIFSATPVEVPLAVEPQGEAVAYAPDGSRYFTSSEQDETTSVALNAVDCRNPVR